MQVRTTATTQLLMLLDEESSLPSCKLCPSIDERKIERMDRIDRELIEAAKENNLPEVIRRLFSVGADVNAKNNNCIGMTPLHKASFRGHVQVIKELLVHGADMDAKDNDDGVTALHCACTNGHLAVVNELVGEPQYR
jgi:ankyrin repeat protein